MPLSTDGRLRQCLDSILTATAESLSKVLELLMTSRQHDPQFSRGRQGTGCSRALSCSALACVSSSCAAPEGGADVKLSGLSA
jgi:hypothetical protein